MLYDAYSTAFKEGNANTLAIFRMICAEPQLCTYDKFKAFCKSYYSVDSFNSPTLEVCIFILNFYLFENYS